MISATNPNFGSTPLHITSISSRRSSPSNQFSIFKSPQAILMTHDQKRRCDVFDMHNELVPYAEAWSWQKSIVEERKMLIDNDEDFCDSLVILQHTPVYTLGTGSSEDHLKGIKDFYRTERGGEVTYHGPGQIVMYPILNLRYHTMDLHWYLRALEEVVMRVLSSTFSIKASRHTGLTGVWVGNQKVSAIGVRASKWITFHGLSVNVTADLTPFKRIVPCGIQDGQVGSIKELLHESLSSEECGEVHYTDNELVNTTYESLIEEFSKVFQVELCIKPISMADFLEQKTSPLSIRHLYLRLMFPYVVTERTYMDNTDRVIEQTYLSRALELYRYNRATALPNSYSYGKSLHCKHQLSDELSSIDPGCYQSCLNKLPVQCKNMTPCTDGTRTEAITIAQVSRVTNL